MPNSTPVADTITGACARLSISRSTVYNEISAGRLRAVKARGRTLILRADGDLWLATLPTLAKST